MVKKHRGLQGGMTGVEGNLVQVHVCPGHMGQAKMSWCMSSKLWETNPLSHLLHNLGPRHQSKGTGGIAMRFGQEEGPRSDERARLWCKYASSRQLLTLP